MRQQVGFECPECESSLSAFHIFSEPPGMLLLRSPCHHCKVIYEFKLTLDNLVSISEGKPIDFSDHPTAPSPKFVM